MLPIVLDKSVKEENETDIKTESHKVITPEGEITS